MRWPFIGRDAELRLIAEALAAGSAGVVVGGPAGVGKSRLIAEAADRAAAEDWAVEWARASGSARAIPLGAFAALLPAPGRAPHPLELLARARQALAERAAGRRLVLCVDDGHQLDDASAALVHQLVAVGEAFALVSVRSDARAPDALRALWKDELCERLELGALSRTEAQALLAAALGGAIDGSSAGALWELTRGNALFLRELVRHGTDRGLLSEDGGVWRWRGEIEAGTRLATLVDFHLDDAGEPGRRLLELLAIGAPLEAGLLAPGELPALQALERAELVQRRADGRRRFVDIAHPLHAEAVRSRLPPTRAEAIHARLSDALQARGARRGGDLLRIAVWRLRAGETGDAPLLTAAAERALAALDRPLAERLARAAAQAGGGFAARMALARALAASGRGPEADRLLAELATEAGDDRQRAAVALATARNLFWALDRAADADAVLRAAEQQMADGALRDELTAQRVRLTAAHGYPRAALAAAERLLHDGAVNARARTTVALGTVEALFASGRIDEAVALVEASVPAARALREEMPYAEVVLLGMRAMALRLAGRLVEATRWSESAYELLLPRRSAVTTAVEAASLGFIWLARGRIRTALRLFRESAALLRDGDAAGMLAFALAGVAQAAAQASERETAQGALAEMERTPLGHKSFAVELELARAWTAAAGGELSRAGTHAAAAAALAAERGQNAYAVRALHELCRLGDPAAAVPELARLAPTVDGPFAAAAAAHAAARDGPGLMDVAERFAGQDALLAAAEAAHAAAAAYRDAGRHSSAARAAARAGRWLAACEGARPPAIATAPHAAGLTRREREVALLAAGGRSSREIADRLVISVRTVDNHLQNAYRKLGVARRQDLPRALAE